MTLYTMKFMKKKSFNREISLRILFPTFHGLNLKITNLNMYPMKAAYLQENNIIFIGLKP